MIRSSARQTGVTRPTLNTAVTIDRQVPVPCSASPCSNSKNHRSIGAGRLVRRTLAATLALLHLRHGETPSGTWPSKCERYCCLSVDPRGNELKGGVLIRRSEPSAANRRDRPHP